ncbi:hypothetical protein PoB_001145800 [Plakobranchus ocellatus]|uniref:Uncharacterized protein n=1 Tax=Plakobranchus ocellatus TaxID=259542 RepID=A0AAV3YRN4_9GAST|nr:hypothetical protein PoB_001145800 [Plakobranchus ocellatus]
MLEQFSYCAYPDTPLRVVSRTSVVPVSYKVGRGQQEHSFSPLSCTMMARTRRPPQRCIHRLSRGRAGAASRESPPERVLKTSLEQTRLARGLIDQR